MSSFLSCARCIINPALSMNFKQRTKCFHVRGRRRRRRRKGSGNRSRKRGRIERVLIRCFGLWPVWEATNSKEMCHNQEAGVAHFLLPVGAPAASDWP